MQVIDLPWGCQIAADIREVVGRSLWTTGIYDLAVSEVLFRLADPGSLALDVGANIGVMSGLMAARGAEVWAFEPFPDTFRQLSENIALLNSQSDFGRCSAFELAASDVDGEAEMECPESYAENSGIVRMSSLARITSSPKKGGAVPIRTARLDSLLSGRKVGVMKIDVEGHELAVLRGAVQSLNEGRVDHIVFEDHLGPDSPTCRFLVGNGFTVLQIGWVIAGPVLAPLTAAVHRVNEAPSYLATQAAASALERCSGRGWRCLRRSRNARSHSPS